MEEKQLRKISRRLGGIRAAITLLIIINLVTLAIFGFLAYKVANLTGDIKNQVNDIKSTTDQASDMTDQFCQNVNLPGGNVPDYCR